MVGREPVLHDFIAPGVVSSCSVLIRVLRRRPAFCLGGALQLSGAKKVHRIMLVHEYFFGGSCKAPKAINTHSKYAWARRPKQCIPIASTLGRLAQRPKQ